MTTIWQVAVWFAYPIIWHTAISTHIDCWAEAPNKSAIVTLTIEPDGSWSASPDAAQSGMVRCCAILVWCACAPLLQLPPTTSASATTFQNFHQYVM